MINCGRKNFKIMIDYQGKPHDFGFSLVYAGIDYRISSCQWLTTIGKNICGDWICKITRVVSVTPAPDSESTPEIVMVPEYSPAGGKVPKLTTPDATAIDPAAIEVGSARLINLFDITTPVGAARSLMDVLRLETPAEFPYSRIGKLKSTFVSGTPALKKSFGGISTNAGITGVSTAETLKV
jgi:hypothetical protein